MTYCATPIPRKTEKEKWKKDLTPDDKLKWFKAQEILDRALEEVWALGLGVHMSYHHNYFLCFDDNRELEDLK